MKSKYKLYIILSVLLILDIFIGIFSILDNKKVNTENSNDSILSKTSNSFSDTSKPHLKKKLNFLSDSLTKDSFSKIMDASEKHDTRWLGKKITISVCGIDSRLGSGTPHADANHLINIWLDSGVVQIISIPRGTLADAGFDDTTGLNYLANVRANRGRKKYLETISEISGVKKIDYYIEFGFSQAIGLLELLGFKDNAVQVLRMLRTRKSFGIGDVQRVYNQGQFIRQMVLNNFKMLDGLAGKALLYGGLLLVDTNLDYETVQNIIKRLKEKNFPKNSDDAFVTIKPKFRNKFEDFNFLDNQSRDSLYKFSVKASKFQDNGDDSHLKSTDISKNVSSKLHQAINNSQKDTLRYPVRVISRLERLFEQRAWYQVIDTNDRNQIRDDMLRLLARAYSKTNQTDKEKYVRLVIESEKNIKYIK